MSAAAKGKWCKGCGHEIDRHFKNVRGVVRCAVAEHGHSTRGIIGIPYTKSCDCADWKVPEKKPTRTGTVYDDEIALAHDAGERLRKYVKAIDKKKVKR